MVADRLRKHAAYSAALRHMSEMEKEADAAGFINGVKAGGRVVGRVATAPLRVAGSVAAAPVKAGVGALGSLGRGLAGAAIRSPLKSLVGGLTLAGGASTLRSGKQGFRTAANVGNSLASPSMITPM